MNILGVELPDIDYLDVDVMEKVNEAFQKVVDDVGDKGQYSDMKNTDAIRYQCKSIDNFLDTVFGAGTAQRVFKGKVHYGEHLKAFGIVSEFVQEKKGEINDLMDEYSPNRIAAIPQNRQQRRQNQKQKYNNRPKNYGINNNAALNGGRGN